LVSTAATASESAVTSALISNDVGAGGTSYVVRFLASVITSFNVELDRLSNVQGTESGSLNLALVDEVRVALRIVNEPVSFSCHPFGACSRSFGHYAYFLSINCTSVKQEGRD